MVKEIAKIAVPVALRSSFDYLIPDTNLLLEPGMRVKIPFKNKENIGIFLEGHAKTEVQKHKLKTIIEIIDKEPILTTDLIELCQFASDYYQHPIGEVFAAALPAYFRQIKSKKKFDISNINKNLNSEVVTSRENICENLISQEEHILNSEQQNALEKITTNLSEFKVYVLDGVTGSGKTEVYLQSIKHVLQQQKQILVLVPEIGLTPQTIKRFSDRFSVPIVALHSRLTEKKRAEGYLSAKHNHAKIIIGTRSALFSSFTNLGMIIVDEEHDHSFKQHDGFRYHARDLAVLRARHWKIPIILGSATPSLETLHNIQQKGYVHLQLQQRAGGAIQPRFELIDIRNKTLDEGISQPLLQTIHEHIDRNEQVMLFLNRRGFAPVLMCHGCGFIVNCKHCDLKMTYHQSTNKLHCHHCNAQQKFFQHCPHCDKKQLHAIGLGTQRIESVLKQHFPDVSIVRIDRDSTKKKKDFDDILEKIQNGVHKILIGTQMIAKGHHFPNVTLVAVLNADNGFFSSDFRAIEQMGQLILQVAGRSGREEKPGKVMIQTHHPGHPLLQTLIFEGYASFAKKILAERQMTGLPPYSFFAIVRAEANQQHSASQFLQRIQQISNPLLTSHPSIQMCGPQPALLAKCAGRFRMQLLYQAEKRSNLQNFLKLLIPKIEKLPGQHKVRWTLDIDPMELF